MNQVAKIFFRRFLPIVVFCKSKCIKKGVYNENSKRKQQPKSVQTKF